VSVGFWGGLQRRDCHLTDALHPHSIPSRDFRVSFSAFEMTLAEGNKLEKKLFYSTFATVSNKQYSA
jgi:hypothetical protein